jgi:outer membrane lipoprotein
MDMFRASPLSGPRARYIALAVVAAVLMAAGCATETGGCRVPVGYPALTPAAAAADSTAVGQRTTWGGTLVEARNLAETTELEMIGYPLNTCGRPLRDEDPIGRFIILRTGYLETATLRPGDAITATGTIVATREGRIGETFYRFPLILDPNPRRWSPPGAPRGGRTRPWISIGIGAGSGWTGGRIGVIF